jgi:indolepyruvate ferredoxin oxidoreductase
VVTGVGGTGVLTITALVAMAAHIEGKGCATLNQTGLAQKFGAVVSHVRVAREQDDIQAVRIPAGEADLLLGCDLVVTTTYDSLGKAAHGRTHAVVNDAEVPTASFITNPDARFPTAAMKQRVREEVGDSRLCISSTPRVSPRQLLGDSIASNLFLLGVAWQRGLVPVSALSLERAIELNGVAVDFNKRAFLFGRRYAHRPEQVLALLPERESPPRLDSSALIEDRAARLADYQDADYAQRFRARLAGVRSADPQSRARMTRSPPLRREIAVQADGVQGRVRGCAALQPIPRFCKTSKRPFDGDYEPALQPRAAAAEQARSAHRRTAETRVR